MTGREPDNQQYSHIAANVAMCIMDSLRAVFGKLQSAVTPFSSNSMEVSRITLSGNIIVILHR